MDQHRQIRFLIPPFFLYASILWWGYIDPKLHCQLAASVGGNLRDVLPILAAVGAATLPLGFSIGTFGVLILKCFASACWRLRSGEPRQIYDAWLSKKCFSAILLATKAPDKSWNRKRPTYSMRQQLSITNYFRRGFTSGCSEDLMHSWWLSTRH